MEKKFVIVDCSPTYKKNCQKGWPTGFDDSQIVLNFGCYYSDITSFLKRSDFSSKLKKKLKVGLCLILSVLLYGLLLKKSICLLIHGLSLSRF